MSGDPSTTLELGHDTHTEPVQNIKELMEVNKLWKQQCDLLQKNHQQEKGQLQEDMIKLKQEVRRSELRCSKLEAKNSTLQSELVRLARSFEALHPQSSRADNETGDKTEDVELIKEQLDLYKEDFKLEHEDKEKIQSEKASLQGRLEQYENLVHSLTKELDLYKSECKRLQDEKGRSTALLQRHPSVDRSHSYPSTSNTFMEAPFSPVPNSAMPPSLEAKRDGYLTLQDFRHEQLKRGILVRNPSQVRPPPVNQHRTLRRLSDSSSSSSTPVDQLFPRGSSSRTSCLW